MAIRKFSEVYSDHGATFGRGDDVIQFGDYSLYSDESNKIGSIKDALFDDVTGSIRYLIADTGFWVFGKKVLLPIGLANFDRDQKRVYVNGLTEEDVKNLPDYDEDMVVDRDYEDRVRTGYRGLGDARKKQFMGQTYREDERVYPGSAALYGASVEGTTGTERMATAGQPAMAQTGEAYDYDREPGLYGMDMASHNPIRLYQERLIADKDRFKTGEVVVGKRVETETKDVSVPVEKERVIIERTAVDGDRPAVGTPDFNEGEVARVETYAEEAKIGKEAFVRESVNVRKDVERETVTGKETLRREELDVKTDGDTEVVRR